MIYCFFFPVRIELVFSPWKSFTTRDFIGCLFRLLRRCGEKKLFRERRKSFARGCAGCWQKVGTFFFFLSTLYFPIFSIDTITTAVGIFDRCTKLFFFLSPFFRSCLLFVKSVIVRTQTSRHSVPIVIFFFLLTFFPPCQRRGFPFFFYQFLFCRPVWIPKTGNQTSNIRGTVINVSLFNFCFISKLLATIHLCVVSVILSFSIDYASSCM